MINNSNFSEYVVYVDESGDHSLTKINPDYPIFVLAFCIFRIDEYCNSVIPAFKKFKFDFFGHDLEILHEREIRKQFNPFEFLRDAPIRDSFFDRLHEIIENINFKIVAVAIKKEEYSITSYVSDSPYKIAMKYGLERVFYELQSKGQSGKKTRIIFESRGKKEDKELELEFRRLMDTTHINGMAVSLEFITASKQANIIGLQVADLVARPIGMSILKPEQANRAVGRILEKVRKSPSGQIIGFGLKILPQKPKTPENPGG